MDDGALHLSRLAGVGQRPERGPALDVLLLGEAAPVEELPPHGLVLATMEPQQVRQEPPRPLFAVELGVVGRQPGGERLEQRPGLDRRFLLPIAFLVPERRPRHGLAGESLQFLPALLQPRGEAQRREAVVTVVALELGPKRPRDTGRVARLEPRLDLNARPRRRGQVQRAGEAVERLQRLERVALDRGSQPLPDHAVEVDEHAAAK